MSVSHEWEQNKYAITAYISAHLVLGNLIIRIPCTNFNHTHVTSITQTFTNVFDRFHGMVRFNVDICLENLIRPVHMEQSNDFQFPGPVD